MLSTFTCHKKNARLTELKTDRSPKPLSKYKFYLEVKNRSNINKLETQITNFGGNIELFLTRDVTHVITDRETWCDVKGGESDDKTPSIVSNDRDSHVSPVACERNEKIRPKTRADAMLERARQQTNVVVKDPLDEAKQWGIAIWSVNKAFIWLKKVLLSVKATIEQKKAKLQEFKAPFIKLEAFSRTTRPVFQEIPNWPVVNLNGKVGDPGFLCRSPGERNMTRKTRNNHQRIGSSAIVQLGYCEICHTEYTNLDKHLESDKHRNFLKNEDNFLGLDNLINTGSSIQSFLKSNGFQFDGKCNNLSELHVTKNKMPRTRTSSACEKINSLPPLSPTASETNHYLRPRRQTTVSSYLSNGGTEDFKAIRELRSSGRLLGVTKSPNKSEHIYRDPDTWESGRPKRSCSKIKRLSTDERFLDGTRAFYKVELLNSKVRSSGQANNTVGKEYVESPARKQSLSTLEENEDDKGLIVKFKKLRSSELLQLNNEAENFLFPRKCENTSDASGDDIDGDGPNTTVSSKKTACDSSLLLSSEQDTKLKIKYEHDEEISMDSYCSETSNDKRKKRRTQAEAFIMDNQKYYKFETPGSRLRYQGSYLHPISPKMQRHNGEYQLPHRADSLCPDIGDDDNLDDKNKLNIDELQFSFERIPKSEPWYETFQRQDNGEEYYTCFSDSGYWKPFLLPYEMPPLTPLDPRICVSAYSKLKKEFMGANSDCNTPSSSCNNGSTPTMISDKNDDEIASMQEIVSEEKVKRGRGRKRGRKRGTVGRNPRKSPRQHASTLAILSSFIQQRKRRDMKNKSPEQSPGNNGLPTIVEEGKLEDIEPDYEQIAKTIDDLLEESLENLDQIEIATDDLNVGIHYKSNVISMLEDYVNKKEIEPSASPVKNATNVNARRLFGTATVGRKPGRKRKKNRTGWPNKSNRRTVSRKDENHGKEDGEVSDMDSVVDSPSVYSEDNDETANTIETEKPIKTATNKSKTRGNRNEVNSANVNSSEINYSVQSTKLNGTKSAPVSSKKRRRGSSSDSSAEIVTEGDKVVCVNVVDLDKWEIAEKTLTAKVSKNDELHKQDALQPIVRVQKLLENDITVNHVNSVDHGELRTKRTSPMSPQRTKHPRRMPASPKSPRTLRKPRGRWYRERY